jgi:hypothetical protein
MGFPHRCGYSFHNLFLVYQHDVSMGLFLLPMKIFGALALYYFYRYSPIIFQFSPNHLSFISSVDNYPYLSTMAVDNLYTYRFPFISS